MFADIILPLPLDATFTYAVPEALASQVVRGSRVAVPFGKSKRYVGIVEQVHDVRPEGYEVKPILLVLDRHPIVTESQLQLWHWIADYYMSPIGEVMNAALPAGLKDEDGFRPRCETYIRLTPAFQTEQSLHIALDMLARSPKQQQVFATFLEMARESPLTRDELLNATGCTTDIVRQLVRRGFIETYEVEVGRLNSGVLPQTVALKPLTAPQLDAYNSVLFSFLSHRVTLLHGVTSSGKTEIYIHLIQREIEQHRQVLYLLPEIALTVQMMDRLRQVFGPRLGIYHSKYSDAERVEIWQKQLSDAPYDVILGARSAVFLPFQRLGLVIIDEEHENSFKQQEPMPRYHARSVAIMMAQATADAHVLLGTATPSAESLWNARQGKYGLTTLMERYQGIELPEIRIVDTRDLQHRRMMQGPFSPELLLRVREALARGEQAIIFQNRRGWAPMVECRQCGWVPRCDHCDVSLTVHRNTNQLTCHYCGMTYRIPEECPACGSKELRSHGYGTEKIEDQLRTLIPEARIARMDLDTTRSRQAYERLISDFSALRTNLLVGTQMVTKGLDFGHVSVVGILSADTMLNQPDFRAYEHAFAMMTQVAGRAGRKGKRGLVLLQTRQPEEEVIDQVVRLDYDGFYDELFDERQAFHYPPFTRLIYVYLKHKRESVVETAAIEMGTRLRQFFGTRILGPDKPPVARIKTLAIRKLVIKLEPGISLPQVRQCLRTIQSQMMQDRNYSTLQIYFDVDPQ